MTEDVSDKSHQPSTSSYLLLHFAVPLVPFILGAVVRFLSNPGIGWNTFDAAELALSMGLVTIFVAQGLLAADIPLPNEDIRAEMHKAAQVSYALSFGFIVLFAAVEIFNTLVSERRIQDLELSLRLSQGSVFPFTAVALTHIIRVQRSFKLKAKTA